MTRHGTSEGLKNSESLGAILSETEVNKHIERTQQNKYNFDLTSIQFRDKKEGEHSFVSKVLKVNIDKNIGGPLGGPHAG